MDDLKVYEYNEPGSNQKFQAQLSTKNAERYKKAGFEVREAKSKPANKASGAAANKAD